MDEENPLNAIYLVYDEGVRVGLSLKDIGNEKVDDEELLSRLAETFWQKSSFDWDKCILPGLKSSLAIQAVFPGTVTPNCTCKELAQRGGYFSVCVTYDDSRRPVLRTGAARGR